MANKQFHDDDWFEQVQAWCLELSQSTQKGSRLQFRLRTLLAIVAVSAGVFALIRSLGIEQEVAMGLVIAGIVATGSVLGLLLIGMFAICVWTIAQRTGAFLHSRHRSGRRNQ